MTELRELWNSVKYVFKRVFGLSAQEKLLWEAKHAGRYFKEDEILQQYYAQIKHQNMVAGAASPDPEGEWHWVPNTHLVAPKMITSVMCVAGQNAAEDKIDCVEVGQIYRAILAARPPVPKKGESA